jgi:hypothetical protein
VSGGSFDDLLREAQEMLRERADDDPNAALGDDMTPEPEQHFMGRWRGDGQMITKERGTIAVYLVWDRDGNPGFLYQTAKLVQEVETEQPQVGDEVLVLRGATREFETKGGELRKTFPYVLRKRECSDPLPETPAALPEAASGKPAADDDIPF